MSTPTTPLGIDIDLTTDYFEEHWVVIEKHWDDEAKCESNHSDPRNTDCSIVAVGVARNCFRPVAFLVCQEWVNRMKERLAVQGVCICGLPTSECWKLVLL